MVCQDVGRVLTVPLETSYTRLKSPSQGDTGIGLLVFRFREDPACQFELDCSYWGRVKTDLYVAGSKLRWHGVQNSDGLGCPQVITSG